MHALTEIVLHDSIYREVAAVVVPFAALLPTLQITPQGTYLIKA